MYDFSATIYYDLCCRLDKLCICENPKDCLYWETTPWKDRQYAAQDFCQDHQACAYGSLRPKWTKLTANFSEIHAVDGTCDGQHKHAPWGFTYNNGKRVYATSLEVHYPLALCEKLADVIVQALANRGITAQPPPLTNLAARSIAQDQPASNKLPSIVPEFKLRCIALFVNDICVWPMQHAFVEHSKQLQKANWGCESLQQEQQLVQEQCLAWNVDARVDVQMAGLVFSM